MPPSAVASNRAEAGTLESATVHRVQLYGASNLWLSRRAALAGLRERFDGPLEIGLACGPGRSYGLSAGNALVRYRPLCSVEFPHPPQLAILADAGNDIAYGQDPAIVLGWMTELATRLERQGARILVTGTPLENLRTIPAWLFKAVRSLIYPRSLVTQEGVVQALEDLKGGVQTLARERGYVYLEPDPIWYGMDRIHLHSAHYRRCWEHWLEFMVPRIGPRMRLPGWLSTLRLSPARCRVLGREWRGQGDYIGFMEQTRLLVR